ncbi:MAG: T9SS type A sorting domain-containing protein [Ignavibacteriales bacterium]|nr:T9SS type A sorting domain-containing protein [Ignavibacteriales bacterium]MCB9218231.1 T9SS type A sorting domain-containing protein [Ignavibacteriales bacterium]
MRIGKSNGTIQSSNFNGILDELYIFDKLIDNEKIIELYTLNAKLKAPSNLTLSFIDDNTIKLLWEDNSIREDGYEIERKLSDGSFNLISLINSNIKTFIDFDKDNNLEYCYRIRAFKDVEFASYSDYSNEVCTNITEFDEELNIANIFELSQNYPNPFNPITTISYLIPQSTVIANEVKQSNEITSVNSFPRNDNFNVSLKIYDVLGKEVATLVNKTQSAGNYEVHFDASEFPSGVYYYQLKASNFIQTKKMVLLK